MATCRSCGAEIRWERTAAGKAIPLDPAPVSEGNIDVVWTGGSEVAAVLGPDDALAAQAAGHRLYLTHFATCPNAATHRKT
jgi:hypothetical protein